MKTSDGGRVFGLLVLLALAFSLSLTDVVYASPGPYVTGCRWLFQAGLWVITALVAWVDAGSLLPIIIDLYKVIGGSRVGRIEDSVSGTGSKEYTFSNIPGQADDRFIVDVQFFDANKNDWVHTPDRPGIIECPRPATQREITTTTISTTIFQENTVTVVKAVTESVYVPAPPAGPAFDTLYVLALLILAFLVGITGGTILANVGAYGKLGWQAVRTMEQNYCFDWTCKNGHKRRCRSKNPVGSSLCPECSEVETQGPASYCTNKQCPGHAARKDHCPGHGYSPPE